MGSLRILFLTKEYGGNNARRDHKIQLKKIEKISGKSEKSEKADLYQPKQQISDS